MKNRPANDSTAAAWALGWSRGRIVEREELLAVEEPLEIRLGGRRFTLTMRTPGDDRELVAGFLFTEGLVSCIHELDEIRQVTGRRGKPEPNIVDVIMKVPADHLRERLKRNFMMTSSCGVCGKTSIASITRRVSAPNPLARVAAGTLLGLPAAMRAKQAVFAQTGGVHAAAISDLTGKIRALREDVGRHNAVDKVVGWALGERMVPLSDAIMVVSGRLSFEVVQKAAAAGVPIVAAISAPSSLAARLARDAGTTLVGFLRDAGFNIYSHPERIID